METFTEQVEILVSTFRNAKGVVDLQPAFFRFTLATSTALLFGESIETLSRNEQKEFAEHFDRASRITAVRLPLADLCFLYNTWAYRKSCKIVKRYADYFVKRALRHSEDHGYEEASEKYAFILDLYNDYKDPTLVRDQLVNVLLAGRDTTACTMSWTM